MRIAQIGTGQWGGNHARVLSEMGVLCAVCDSNRERCAEYSDRYGVPGYDSVDELLSSEFDAALVCTPTTTHYRIAKALIEHGRHVFVEKPLTYDSRDGERLAEMAAKKKVVLTAGYIERFNPAVDGVKEIVLSGTYGKLLMLEFHRENRIPVHIKDIGIIYDTAVHDIDTALWLFDGTPNVVFARAGRVRDIHEDFATIMLGFGENRVASISSNWITPVRVRRFGAVLTDAIISSDFLTQETRIDTHSSTEIPRREKVEPLRLEIENFVEAASGRAKARVSAADAINVTKIAEAALLSSERGVPIYLDLR